MNLPRDFFPRQNTEIHETKSTVFWFESGTQYVYCKPNVKHSISDAKKQVDILLKQEMGEDIKCNIICDVRKGIPLEKEVRDFYGSDETQKHVKKFAFIVDSLVSRVIANFFMNLKTMKVPIKLFNDIKTTENWIKSEI